MTRPAVILGRALALAIAQTALAVLILAMSAFALHVRVALENAAILALATTLLGSVWAVRQYLTSRGASPALVAALVPAIASALFVAPRLLFGRPEPALATLAASTAASAFALFAWPRFVARDESRLAARAGLAVALPVLSLALAAGCVSLPSLAGGSLAACALFAGAFLAAGRSKREREAFAAYVRGFEVTAERVARPPAPVLRDPALRALDRELSQRAVQISFAAHSDARSRGRIADARELRTRFMASMSHELRSPLNSIVGFAQLLEGEIEGALEPGQRESVTMIRRSAEELILLLTDIIDLARLEAGKLRLHRRWTPSVEILTEAVRGGQAIVEGRDVAIEAELQPGLPPVHVDQQRIVQAVVALFRNAALSLRKATIRLRARTAAGPPGPERHLRVEIHDARSAIPREDVERIFEAFQEITEPMGRRVGGLGMALTLSRGLVRLHGGDVWAETAHDTGTILCIAIPLEASDEEE